MNIFDDDDDKSDDDDKKDKDDAAGFGSFVYNKSQELPKFTSFSPTVTCSSMKDFTNLLNDLLVHELTNLLSKPVYTYAQTTLVVVNLEGNPKNHLHQQLQHMTWSQILNKVQSKKEAKKLMAKAKQKKRKSIFKQATKKKFKEYDQKLEAFTSINVPEAIEEVIQAKVLTEMKKQLPTHVPTTIAKFVKHQLNKTVLEVMQKILPIFSLHHPPQLLMICWR
nr:hypothetical protein [Tanacetum cinerariifolium]